MSMTTVEDWTVKNVKTFEGMEGQGFDCSLYVGGNRAAKVFDDASGGPLMIHWRIPDAEVAMVELCKTLPKWGSEYGGDDDMDVTPDIFINRLIDEFLVNKQLKGKCRARICWYDSEEKKAEGIFSMTGTGMKFTKANVEKIRKQYNPIEIINYRFGEPE